MIKFFLTINMLHTLPFPFTDASQGLRLLDALLNNLILMFLQRPETLVGERIILDSNVLV